MLARGYKIAESAQAMDSRGRSNAEMGSVKFTHFIWDLFVCITIESTVLFCTVLQ